MKSVWLIRYKENGQVMAYVEGHPILKDEDVVLKLYVHRNGLTEAAASQYTANNQPVIEAISLVAAATPCHWLGV